MSDTSQVNIYQKDRYPVKLELTDNDIIVTLSDGTRITNPIDWFPWLRDATPHEQQDYKLYHTAIFWDALDDGIDIEGMLRGIQPKYPQSMTQAADG